MSERKSTMHKAAFDSRTYVLVDVKCTLVNGWMSEWIANKSPMLRKHTIVKRRRLSFPAHVHRVSAMVFVSAITIPTLCKSIIERETYDHFSSTYVACALEPLSFSLLYFTSSLLLLLSPPSPLTHNYTLEQHTLPRAINALFHEWFRFASAAHSSRRSIEISVVFPSDVHRVDDDLKAVLFELVIFPFALIETTNRKEEKKSSHIVPTIDLIGTTLPSYVSIQAKLLRDKCQMNQTAIERAREVIKSSSSR